MHDLPTIDSPQAGSGGKAGALRSGLRKRAAGVPTYSVPEAAALLSVSREHLYRLIRAGAFPVLRMGLDMEHRRYVVAARTIEELLERVAPAHDGPFAPVADGGSGTSSSGDGGR